MLNESGFGGRHDRRFAEDLVLAWRELVELGRPGAGDAGELLAGGDRADPIAKLRRRRVFEQEVARARLDCVVDVLV